MLGKKEYFLTKLEEARVTEMCLDNLVEKH